MIVRITIVELDSTGPVSHAQDTLTLGTPDRRAAPENDRPVFIEMQTMQTRARKMPSTVYIVTLECLSTA